MLPEQGRHIGRRTVTMTTGRTETPPPIFTQRQRKQLNVPVCYIDVMIKGNAGHQINL